MLNLISKTHYASAVLLLATSPLFAMDDEQPGAPVKAATPLPLFDTDDEQQPGLPVSARTHQVKPTKEVADTAVTTTKPSELQLQPATITKKSTTKPKKKPTSPEEDGYETVDHASLNAMMRLEAVFLVKTIGKDEFEGRTPSTIHTLNNVSRVCSKHNTGACFNRNCSESIQWRRTESKTTWWGVKWEEVVDPRIKGLVRSILAQNKKI